MADRIEHGMEIAREVPRRLFPQAVPQVPNAQCAARCIQLPTLETSAPAAHRR